MDVSRMDEKASADKWWNGGVRFACIECGRCCRGEPGAIFFTPEEGQRVRDFLGLSEMRFRSNYVTMMWGWPSFVERQNGDCVFYDVNTSKCSIYPIRPAQCALFPFWPSVIESKEEWNAQAKHCPGMNEGHYHSAEVIRAAVANLFFALPPFNEL
jgi:Fe-S-cluster containining protein